MEDTLRYFFSAVFQGFAAIITLGIMFYLYYLDKLKRSVSSVEERLLQFTPSVTAKDFKERHHYLLNSGIVKYVKKYIIDTKSISDQTHEIIILMNKYDSIEEQRKLLSEKLKILFKIARVILIISLISLFIVGYDQIIDCILLISGFTCIILSMIFFNKLFSFSKEIIDNPF